MDYFDEDCSRPRFVFQSKQLQSSSSSLDQQQQQDQFLQDQKPSKLFIFITITISSILLIASILYIQTEPFQSLLFWVSLSLLIGPFAPSSITGGHVRVGHGPTLEPDEPIADEQQQEKIHQETKRKTIHKRPNSNPVVRSESPSFPVIDSNGGNSLASEMKREKNDAVLEEVKETDWTDEDFDMLKKQLAKNPVGKPKRWEVITEAFRGRHRLENVIKKAKEMGERKLDGKNDDYAQFLKNRKPMDVKKESENKSEIENVGEFKKENGDLGWSSGEDIALLNALKVFTKDVPMRWEKIAAAVPGKSKAGCMKRVTELKKEFRSSKANATDN